MWEQNVLHFKLNSDKIVWKVGEKKNSSAMIEFVNTGKKILLVTRNQKSICGPKTVKWCQEGKTTRDRNVATSGYFNVLNVGFQRMPQQRRMIVSSESHPKFETETCLLKPWLWIESLLSLVICFLMAIGSSYLKDDLQASLSDTRWDSIRAK